MVLATYFCACTAGLQLRTAFWASVIVAFSPLGLLGSFLTTSDGGLVFFWVLAFSEYLRGLQKDMSFWRLGLWIGLGALFKWPIYLAWIFILPLLYLPKFRSKQLLGALALSLLGLLPSLYWNSTHDWATFRHVMNTVQGGGASGLPPPPNPLDFFGAQMALLSPVPFVLWLWGTVKSGKEWRQVPLHLRFLGLVSLSIFLVYQGLAFHQKMQGNWCVYLYPPAAIFTAWWWLEFRKARAQVLAWGMLASVFCVSFLCSLPLMQERGWISFGQNPFRHAQGWAKLGEHLSTVGYDPSRHFLAGEKYQEVSELSFYPEGKKRAYFFNLHKARRNQFCYWEQSLGDEGYFVLTANEPSLSGGLLPQLGHYHRLLGQYFSTVEYLGTYPLGHLKGEVVKGACLFHCGGYKGRMPSYGEVF